MHLLVQLVQRSGMHDVAHGRHLGVWLILTILQFNSKESTGY